MWINLDPEELQLIKDQLGKRRNGAYSTLQPEHGLIQSLIGKFTQWEADARSLGHRHYRNVAWEKYHRDGELEIDDNGDGTVTVSPSSDGGAYVMAWRWVEDDEADVCPSCNDFPGSATYGTVGDGYNGLCPSCADKAEGEDEDDA